MKQKLSELTHFTEKQIIATQTADQFRYTLFGGAAGPGKSYWLRWYCIRQLIKWYKRTGIKGIRGGLFSEDYPTLKDRQISKMQTEFPKWLGTIKETKIDGLCFFLAPSFGGGILALRNLDDPSKYLSSEFALIAVEELTKNVESTFNMLRMRLRWTGIEDTRFIAATNPGEIGHAWVKKRWIDADFDAEEKEPDQFAYVPALPTDNPHLAASYLLALQSLPEKLRKAYLKGSWDVFEGQYFSEWDKNVHVVAPFKVPDTWKKVRSIDHGRAKPTACLWGAIDHDGRIWWYREYYMAGQDADLNAKEIARLSGDEVYAMTLLDSACFNDTGNGETIAEIYERNGVKAMPWPKNRIAGWNLFHEYLREDPIYSDTGIILGHEPKMRFFSTCVNSIRTIPTLVHDEHRAEDLDSDGEDHAADAVRGLLEALHESKSPKPKDPVEEMLEKLKQKQSVGVHNLKRFYQRQH